MQLSWEKILSWLGISYRTFHTQLFLLLFSGTTFRETVFGSQPMSLIGVLMQETTVQNKMNSHLIYGTGKLIGTFLENETSNNVKNRKRRSQLVWMDYENYIYSIRIYCDILNVRNKSKIDNLAFWSNNRLSVM